MVNAMRKKMSCLGLSMMLGFWGVACGGPDGDLGTCRVCLSQDGPCQVGCGCEDPVLACRVYTAALCQAELACRGDDGPGEAPWPCGADCAKANDCELLALSAYPAEQDACIAALPGVGCQDGQLAYQPPACRDWLILAEAAITDSTCRQDGVGESDIQVAGPGGV